MRSSIPRSALTGSLLFLSATLLAAGDFTSITGLDRTEGGKMSFTIPSDPDSYHVLRRAFMPHMTATGRPVAVIRGAEGGVTSAVHPRVNNATGAVRTRARISLVLDMRLSLVQDSWTSVLGCR